MDEIPEGATVERYADAVMIRAKNGKWLPGSKPINTIKSSEQGKALVKRRHEKAQEIALQAVNDAALQSGVIIPEAIEPDYVGWYAINNHLSGALFMSDNLRGISEASKALGHNTGMIDKQDESQGDITVSSDLRDLIKDIADIVRG